MLAVVVVVVVLAVISAAVRVRALPPSPPLLTRHPCIMCPGCAGQWRCVRSSSSNSSSSGSKSSCKKRGLNPLLEGKEMVREKGAVAAAAEQIWQPDLQATL